MSTPDDCQVAADSISVARRIIQGKHIHEEYPEKLEGSVLSPYNPEEVRPGVHLVSNEELVDGARGWILVCTYTYTCLSAFFISLSIC